MHYPPTQIAESGVKNFFSDDGSDDAAPNFAPQFVWKRTACPHK